MQSTTPIPSSGKKDASVFARPAHPPLELMKCADICRSFTAQKAAAALEFEDGNVIYSDMKRYNGAKFTHAEVYALKWAYDRKQENRTRKVRAMYLFTVNSPCGPLTKSDCCAARVGGFPSLNIAQSYFLGWSREWDGGQHAPTEARREEYRKDSATARDKHIKSPPWFQYIIQESTVQLYCFETLDDLDT